ncbi:MAG TPA: DUF4260 domain-containing protein [Candidatus Baltobacteraceae bacterium]|nr:DUF4260 domain-containing protein [Candidatus Baltobacteraceae bacterium]
MNQKAPQLGCVHGTVRSTLRIEAIAVLVALVALYWRTHANWLFFALFLLAPDVAMLAYLRDTRVGAWCYNAFHTYTAPLVCFAVSFYLPVLLPIAIVWGAHIAMDRALGYGLKYDDAFEHTHLGRIGKGH